MAEAFFVTGTDTGVGKTLVAAALLHAGTARGLRTLGLKPVASGSGRGPDGQLLNDDVLALMAAASLPLGYADVNAVTLEPAIAPHLAAREAGIELRARELERHCRRQLSRPHDLAVIEGAGGWRVPLNDGETFADIPRLLGLPVILVVGMRLGCVNHALLSAEAIRADGLRLAGWVASRIDPGMERIEGNIDTIDARIGAPRLGFIPHHPGVQPSLAAPLLDLDRLRAEG